MQIQELQKLMESKDGLDVLIADYQSCFDEIDQLIGELKADNLGDEAALMSAASRLTGLYGSLITVSKMSQAAKINIEAKKFVLLNEEYETANPGAKPLSAAKLDKMTAIEIGDWRTVRNIFEGYTLAAEKAIMTCQSNLKSIKTERIFETANPERV